jgi:hypothetical protein
MLSKNHNDRPTCNQILEEKWLLKKTAGLENLMADNFYDRGLGQAKKNAL